jgi:hypothetical protein
MTNVIPVAGAEVVAFVGASTPGDAPMRLLAIYRSVDGQTLLLPPVSEANGLLTGQSLPAVNLQALAQESEVTGIAPRPARQGHVLWMSSDGVKYETGEEAEASIRIAGLASVDEAAVAGLGSDRARDLLFACLRAGQSVVANGLIAVHCQLTGTEGEARGVRHDLATLARLDQPIAWDQEILRRARPLLVSDAISTALAAEIRRAKRDDMADQLVAGLPPNKRRAADPSPVLQWGWSYGAQP